MKKSSLKKYKDKISSILGVLLIVIAGVALSVEVFAKGINDGSSGMSGGTDDGGQITRPCKTGNCASVRKNGAFWIALPATSDDINPSSLFGLVYNGTHITGCKSGGGTAYILVTRLSGGGLAGPVDIDTTNGKITSGDGGSLPGGAHAIPESEAQAAFNNHADWYMKNFNQAYTGTHLGWFCADPEEITTTTTTPPTPQHRVVCGATRTREKGDTRTRIAVENMTRDGVTSPTTNTWHASVIGSTDSGWSDGGASVYTIAKPGDSVRFLHEVCMGDRFVRMATTAGEQGQWVYDERSHNHEDYTFNIPTNHFQIYANREEYKFPVGGDSVSDINSQAGSVDAYKDLFYSTGVSKATDDRYGIGILSPILGNGSYNCSSIPEFPAFISGGFHIPGFTDRSCTSGNLVGENNTVGKTIVQWHRFNGVKAWERLSHSKSGGCACNPPAGSGDTAQWHWNYDTGNNYSAGTNGNSREWKCQEAGTCCYNKTCNCDQYGQNCSCCQTPTNYELTEHSHHFKYQSTSRDYGYATKTATVYVPYNFETSVDSSITADTVVFQGGSVGASFNWRITPRYNNIVSPSLPMYATITPGDTRVQMIEFLYEPGDDRVISSNIQSSQDPCSYFGGIKCNIIKEETHDGLNKAGYYIGDGSSFSDTRTVPDDGEYIGYKYCVAVGINHTDSHDYQGNTLGIQTGIAMSASPNWNISGASCRTIAKKPSFQVWNGSVYTEGEVNTSITKKILNSGMGHYNNSSTRLFGSWTDYAIIAGKDVHGMSSGAKLGFDNAYYDFRLAGGQPNTDFSNLSQETVSNNSSTKGNSRINASSSISANLERLYSRYRNKAEDFSNSSESNYSHAQKTIITTKTGFQFVYNTSNTSISELSVRATSNPNQTTAVTSKGLYKRVGDKDNDNTLVIYIKGTLTIDRNICLATSAANCGDTDATRLDTYADITTNVANGISSSSLPQILIFADNINIDQNVTRIDAWLISPNGTINTCKDFKIGVENDSLSAREGDGSFASSYPGNCYKTLVVNGPVFANTLKLYRTAGSYHGSGSNSGSTLTRSIGALGNNDDYTKGSIAPAEIFNMRADNYIWAYNQAQRYSEAVVTYTRELAPRY